MLRSIAPVLTLILLSVTPADGLEIQVQPGDHIYVNQIERMQGRPPIYDLMVQGIRLRNDAQAAVTIEWVEALATDDAGRQVLRRLLPQDSAGSASIEAGAHLDFAAFLLVSEFAPSGLEIRARYKEGEITQDASTSVAVRGPEEAMAYGYPLQGSWYMRGIPSGLSHHRWGLATEFAVDFFKVDAEGRIEQGDRVDPENSYGYGEAVLAAADGVVEMVVRGMTQDRAARMRREGETDQAFSQRIGELNQRAMQEHGLGGATGNLIVLQHANGQRTAYAHLKTGSVRVDQGDSVTRGQVIAEVGDTGDSAAVHLHFQVMEASAMRAIPFRFEDVRVLSRELGSWVEPRSAEDR